MPHAIPGIFLVGNSRYLRSSRLCGLPHLEKRGTSCPTTIEAWRDTVRAEAAGLPEARVESRHIVTTIARLRFHEVQS